MKIYVITSGDYSTYYIKHVFLDKGKAENFCRYHTGGFEKLRVEEYDSEDETYDAVKNGYWTISAELDISCERPGACKIVYAPRIIYGPYLSEGDESDLVACKTFDGIGYRVYLTRSFSEAEYEEREATDKFVKIMQDEFSRIMKLANDGERIDLLYPDKNR